MLNYGSYLRKLTRYSKISFHRIVSLEIILLDVMVCYTFIFLFQYDVVPYLNYSDINAILLISGVLLVILILNELLLCLILYLYVKSRKRCFILASFITHIPSLFLANFFYVNITLALPYITSSLLLKLLIALEKDTPILRSNVCPILLKNLYAIYIALIISMGLFLICLLYTSPSPRDRV